MVAHKEDQVKLCRNCQKELQEMFDCYTNTCPECDAEENRILANASGVWIWHSPTKKKSI